MNRTLGWLLLLTALLWGAWADSCVLTTPQPALAASAMLAARMQTWLVALGFSHLLLAWAPIRPASRIWVTQFTVVGTLLGCYSLLIDPVSRVTFPLAAFGAFLNLIGGILAYHASSGELEDVRHRRIGLVAFGFLLDGLLWPTAYLPQPILHSPDTLTIRMVVLARIAAAALPLLAVLSENVTSTHGAKKATHWLDFGALPMVLVLNTASGTTHWVKYLLPIPALAVAGGLWQRTRLAGTGWNWERLWWGLVTASVSVGLLVGLFAFGGPVPAPPGMAAYAELPRRLSRHAHVALVVTGVIALALADPRLGRRRTPLPLVFPLLLVGSGLTAFLPFVPGIPSLWLVVGPCLQGVAVTWGLLDRRNPDEANSVCPDNEPLIQDTS